MISYILISYVDILHTSVCICMYAFESGMNIPMMTRHSTRHVYNIRLYNQGNLSNNINFIFDNPFTVY